LHKQERGIVAQAIGLVVEQRSHQAPQHLFGLRVASRFPLDQVDQPGQPEQLTVRQVGLGHAVRVQQDRVIGFEVEGAQPWRAAAQTERHDGLVGQLRDDPAVAQQQRWQVPGA